MATKGSDMKTKPTVVSVDDFLAGVEPEGRQEDARTLSAMMARISGEPAVMWGPSIVGFGQYHYRYDSGREGDMCRIGFSPRKGALTLYAMVPYHDPSPLLASLGKHSTGKGCLYIKKLSDVDADVLEALVVEGWERMKVKHP
jgi:hypothetical protein